VLVWSQTRGSSCIVLWQALSYECCRSLSGSHCASHLASLLVRRLQQIILPDWARLSRVDHSSMWRTATARLAHSSRSLRPVALSQLRRLSAIAEPMRSRRRAATRPPEPAALPVAVAKAGAHRQAAERQSASSLPATDRGQPAAESATAASSSGSAERSSIKLARARGGSQAAGHASGVASMAPPAAPAPIGVASAAESRPASSAAIISACAHERAAVAASQLEGRQSQRSLTTEVGSPKRQPQTVGSTAPGRHHSRATRGQSGDGEAAQRAAEGAKPSAEGLQPTAAGSAGMQPGAEAGTMHSAQSWRTHGSKGPSMPRTRLRSVPQAVAALAAAILAASSLAVLIFAWRWRGPSGAFWAQECVALLPICNCHGQGHLGRCAELAQCKDHQRIWIV